MTSEVPTTLVGVRYQLEAFLGRGGMGEVYRAKDLTTGAQVAVKRVVLRGGSIDGVLRERFDREIHLAKQLNHPNIVHALDSGEDEAGLYLVMELIAGESLAQLLKVTRRFDWERVVRLGIQLCDALGAMHAAGVLHRDIKTANIMIRHAATATEQPVLIDFGVARHVHEVTGLTSTGMLVGTAEYCAPERIAGLHVDHRADLYALGVLLFRLLTGVMPFEGELTRVIYLHLHTPPPSIRLFEPSVPEDLEAIVRRCLEKDPTARFATAGHLAQALRDVASSPQGPVLIEAELEQKQPQLSVPEMLQFKAGSEEVTQLAPFPEFEALDESNVPRVGQLLVQLGGDTSHELRFIATLSWAARLAPFFDETHLTLRRAARMLERAVAALVRAKGKISVWPSDGDMLLNGERVVAPLHQQDLGRGLADFFARRHVLRLTFERLPLPEDIIALLATFRTGAPPTAPLTTLKLELRDDDPTRLGAAQLVPLGAWHKVVTDLTRLIDEASRGLPFDTLRALHLSDLVVAEASRPGRRLLGVTGRFAGTDSLAAQAANTAFLASAMAIDLGLPAGRVRDVAHLAVSTSVGMIQVYPFAFSRPDGLSDEERGLLRQTPLSVVRVALQEPLVGPAVWRRMLLAYELSSEMGKGLEAPMGGNPLPSFPPSVPTRLVFSAMTYWGLRSPRPNRAPLTPDEIRTAMRGELRLRLDALAVSALERALIEVEATPAHGTLAGAETMLLGTAPPAPTRKLTDRGDEVWSLLATLMESLIRSGLEPRQRILPLILPVVDMLLMQDELGVICALVRQLRQAGTGATGLESVLASALVQHLTDDECLAVLGLVLNDGPLKDIKDFARLLSLVDERQVPALASLLDVVTHPETQALLLDVLALRARQDPKIFIELAKGAPEARAAELIGVLARARERTTLPLLQTQWAKAAPHTRERLLDAAGRLGSGDGINFVVRALKDPEARIRLAALKTLSRSQHPQGGAALTSLCSAQEFAERHADERQAIYEAIAVRADAQGIAFLQTLVAEKPPLLNRARFATERKLLTAALANVGGLQAMHILSSLAQDTRQAAEVRAAAQEGLDKTRKALSGARPTS